MRVPQNVSESFKKRNPALYGAVGAVAAGKRECHPVPALEQNPQGQRGHAGSVALVVSILTLRKRLLDGDNHVAGCKHLRDCIARSLGIDDADPRVTWEYAQAKTEGPQGTIVRLAVKP